MLVIPGSGGNLYEPNLLFAADAARVRGAQMNHLSWSGQVPPEPEARGPWAVKQVSAALSGLPEPLIIAKSLCTLAAGLAADHGLPAVWITPLLHRPTVVEKGVRPFGASDKLKRLGSESELSLLSPQSLVPT